MNKTKTLFTILLTFGIIGICNADQNQLNNVFSQNNTQQPIAQPVNNQQNSVSVPPIGNTPTSTNSPTSDNIPSPKPIVNEANNTNISSVSSWDQDTNALNEIKRKTELLKAQQEYDKAAGGKVPPIVGNGVPQTSTQPVASNDVITATMKDYIAFKNGTKIATILFANGATTEVNINSELYGYKVTKINSEGVVLTKIKNSKFNSIHKNTIFLPRNLPVQNSQANSTNGYSYQPISPDFNSSLPENK